MKSFSISCLLLFVSLSVLAEAPFKATDLLKVQTYGFQDLGLDIISPLEDQENHYVMRSKNHRYFVSGAVTDLWDGVTQELSPLPNIPELPRNIEVSDYAQVFGEGSQTLRLYLTPSCAGCGVSMDTISFFFDPFDHRIELVWLYNNEVDKKVVKRVLCRAQSFFDIPAIIDKAYKMDETAVDSECVDTRLPFAKSIALHQKVYALPYYVNSDGHYIKPIKNNPFR